MRRPVAFETMKTSILFGILAALMCASTGCSQPRVVRGITSRANQVKLLYMQGSDTGIVQCKVNADGSLSACRNMQVTLED